MRKSSKDNIIRFRIHSDLKEQFRQHSSDKGYSISNYLNNFIKSEVSNL